MGIQNKIRLVTLSLIHPKKTIDVLLSFMHNKGILKETALPSGGNITIWLPDPISIKVYLNYTYEADVIAFMDNVLKPGMTVFDVGAHIGYHCLNARKKVSENGKVIAFEPMPDLYNILSLNCKQYKNITLEQMAITDGSKKELTLSYYGVYYSGWTTSAEKPRIDNKKVTKLPPPIKKTVATTSIDNYVADTGHIPDFIKIDIEGSEMDALKGAANTITTHRPVIVFEGGDLARTEANNTSACINYLNKFNYEFFEFNAKNSSIVPHKPKQFYDRYCNILCEPK